MANTKILLPVVHAPSARADLELAEASVRAAEAALAIPFAAYEQLVVDYLEDEFIEIYDRPEVWEEMVTRVVDFLETLR